MEAAPDGLGAAFLHWDRAQAIRLASRERWNQWASGAYRANLLWEVRRFMQKVLESSRYMALLGTFALLVSALVGFAWGAIETARGVILLITTAGTSPQMAVVLIETVDIILISTGLLFFAVSLYELFIGDLRLPEWMVVRDLNALKSKLSSIIILVMAAKFLEKLVTTTDYQSVLYMGLGVAAVALALIAFSYFGKQ
jgi:uncharacterized membrane protein YqhA